MQACLRSFKLFELHKAVGKFKWSKESVAARYVSEYWGGI